MLVALEPTFTGAGMKQVCFFEALSLCILVPFALLRVRVCAATRLVAELTCPHCALSFDKRLLDSSS